MYLNHPSFSPVPLPLGGQRGEGMFFKERLAAQTTHLSPLHLYTTQTTPLPYHRTTGVRAQQWGCNSTPIAVKSFTQIVHTMQSGFQCKRQANYVFKCAAAVGLLIFKKQSKNK